MSGSLKLFCPFSRCPVKRFSKPASFCTVTRKSYHPNVGVSTHRNQKTGLSQPRFAELLGVSVRTLQEWEQGRRAPSGAARTLLLIAAKNPRALLDVA
jgi:DNA-binding transcriptional regulator YiaG